MGRVNTLGLYMGTNVADRAAVFLNPKLLRTHLDIIGPPGVGKSRLLLAIFQQLCRIPKATVVLVNPKGDLARQARDWAVANGLTKRLIWFDPGDVADGRVLGWNPLRANGLPVPTHAKAAREAILASWGQTNIDQTPQLARFLLLTLYVAREQHLTVLEALRLLLPGSPLRQALLPAITNPYVQEALQYLDGLRDGRQDELVASTIARLEAFCMDPIIRNVLTQQEHSINFGEVLSSGQIFIANLELYNPLRADDVKLLGRLMVNDILSHVFNRPEGQRRPVYFLCDEVHVVANTDDLCVGLELGRELGFHAILAHQYPEQLRQQDGTGRLYEAVRDCVRTKVCFGGLSVENLDKLTRELMIDQYDPWTVKDELTGLEVEPVNRWVLQVARTENWTSGTGRTRGSSKTESDGYSHAWSRQEGTAETESETRSSGTSLGAQNLAGVGETVLPTGEVLASNSQLSGAGSASFEGTATSWGRTRSTVHGATEGRSTSHGSGTHEATSEQESRGGSVTQTWVQVTDFLKRRVVTSRQFLPEAEFMTLKLQLIKGLPESHFVLKVPGHAATLVRSPFVRTPLLTTSRRAAALARIYEQPCYGTLEEIREEESKRTARLLEATEPVLLPDKTSTRKRTLMLRTPKTGDES